MLRLPRPHPGSSQQTLASSGDRRPQRTGSYLFYRSAGFAPTILLGLPPGYEMVVWRPSACQPWPANASTRIKSRFLFRTLLHLLGFFADGECGALCVHYVDRLIHYSAFTSRYWRFPFLADGDLQIGDTWTDPAHRGRGIALFAVLQILATKRRPGRECWYVVGSSNAPSIRVAERAGFRLIATGILSRSIGLKLFGSYVPQRGPTPLSPDLRRASHGSLRPDRFRRLRR